MINNGKIFYTPEYTELLDSLIKFFPYSLAFKLYEIQEKEQLTYKDVVLDGYTHNPTIYTTISDYLVYNDFAKYSVDNSNYIILTDKGRCLIKTGSYDKFVEFDTLKREAEIADLKTKKYSWYIEFIKIIIPFALGILSSYLFKGC